MSEKLACKLKIAFRNTGLWHSFAEQRCCGCVFKFSIVSSKKNDMREDKRTLNNYEQLNLPL